MLMLTLTLMLRELLLLSGLLGHAFVIMTSDPSGQRGSRNAGDVYADETDGVQVPFLFLSLSLCCSVTPSFLLVICFIWIKHVMCVYNSSRFQLLLFCEKTSDNCIFRGKCLWWIYMEERKALQCLSRHHSSADGFLKCSLTSGKFSTSPLLKGH